MFRRVVAATVIAVANVVMKVLFLPFNEDDDYLAPRNPDSAH